MGVQGFEADLHYCFGAGVDLVQARLQSADVLTESLLESGVALVHLFVGVGAPAANTGAPGPLAPAAAPAVVQHGFVASCLLAASEFAIIGAIHILVYILQTIPKHQLGIHRAQINSQGSFKNSGELNMGNK